MSTAFHLTNEQLGVVFSPAFFAFTLAILISGTLMDIVGMRRLHAVAAIGRIAGVALMMLAPPPAGLSFPRAPRRWRRPHLDVEHMTWHP